MVEHNQVIGVSELSRIRVTCDSCKAAMEATIGNVGLIFKDGKCTGCGQRTPDPLDLHALASAIEKLSKDQSNVYLVVGEIADGD